ncbi:MULTISPECIES: hypothetical protein [Vibrio]|uniref:Uncharacterized protein n=1 Tax=Vibrio ezurae NBRC 102218 TaxID=1219080 RepID=U3AFE6_9VIBR|nr:MULTISPECIES: hypothetical protein [Vibrio]MPW34865.1 hypothetical protein [Vibrio sp. B1Z05]GAD78651.1 hypothetical protein VEZ01S_05_00390 [Vibrio ezurae NBRC 102218]
MGSEWEEIFGVGNSGADMVHGDFRHQEQKRLDAYRAKKRYSSSTDQEYIDNDTNSNEGHTYDKWRELGYQVRRGEKAAYKYYGKSIFTRDQVEEA